MTKSLRITCALLALAVSSMSWAYTAKYSRTTIYSTNPLIDGQKVLTISDKQQTAAGQRSTFSMQFNSALKLIASRTPGVTTTPGSVETITQASTGLVSNANMSETIAVSTSGCSGFNRKIVGTNFTPDSTNVGACTKCQDDVTGNLNYRCAAVSNPTTCTSWGYPTCLADETFLGNGVYRRVSGTSTAVYYAF